MKKIILLIIILAVVEGYCNCQTKNQTAQRNSESFKSLKYVGVYKCGTYLDTASNGHGGEMIIYALSNDTVLFYLEVSRGAPSFNVGSLYDRLNINSDKVVFYRKFDFSISSCKLELTFNDGVLTIKTLDYDCGFGANVYADGTYKRIDSNQPKYFEDLHGNKIYFKVTKPESYIK